MWLTHARHFSPARARERVCVCVCDTRSCVWYAISHTTMCYFMSWCSDRGAVFFREIYKITFSQVIFSLFRFSLFLYSNAETFDANKRLFDSIVCLDRVYARYTKDKNFYAAWQNPVNKEKSEHVEHIQFKRLPSKAIKFDLKNNCIFILKMVSQNAKT